MIHSAALLLPPPSAGCDALWLGQPPMGTRIGGSGGQGGERSGDRGGGGEKGGGGEGQGGNRGSGGEGSGEGGGGEGGGGGSGGGGVGGGGPGGGGEGGGDTHPALTMTPPVTQAEPDHQIHCVPACGQTAAVDVVASDDHSVPADGPMSQRPPESTAM